MPFAKGGMFVRNALNLIDQFGNDDFVQRQRDVGGIARLSSGGAGPGSKSVSPGQYCSAGWRARWRRISAVKNDALFAQSFDIGHEIVVSKTRAPIHAKIVSNQYDDIGVCVWIQIGIANRHLLDERSRAEAKHSGEQGAKNGNCNSNRADRPARKAELCHARPPH